MPVLVALLAALSLLLSACGSGGQPADAGRGTATHVGRCGAEAAAVRTAPVLATADLDGDGQGDAVHLTAKASRCPNVLFAKLGTRFASLDLGRADVAGHGRAVRLTPGKAELVMLRQTHPRGGVQVRLYGLARPTTLAEVTADGHPLVPFIATDTGADPVSADCGRHGGAVVTSARPTNPPGVVTAWDLFRTVYDVQGVTATARPEQEVRSSVPDKVLRRQHPELFGHRMFTGCPQP